MEAIQLKKDKIYLKLKQAIISGKLPASKKLPRETELAKSLKVGRITLRSSLDRLEHDGYVKRVHGKGTFVSPESVKPATTATIMIVRGSDGGFESPYNYIMPEIIRIAERKDFKTLSTTDAALLMFSPDEIKNYVKQNNVIGIAAIMNHFRGNEPVLEKLRSAEAPVILTHAGMKDTETTGFASIVVNEREGWEMAISYLAECGHKNISALGLADNRFRGFDHKGCLELLKQHGAKAVKSWVVGVKFDKEAVKSAVRNMFSGNTRPTAILCYSDFCAIYVYEALKEMNLDIPGDVAVMGNCGYPDARLLAPPLSTVDYEYSRFAEMAVEMLEEPEQWFSSGKGKLRIKPFKLRKRQSTSRQINKNRRTS